MQTKSEQVQKGWLSRWTRKQWSRHWFVLKSGSLTYYRGPAAELCSFLDGVLDLSLIKHIEVHQPKSGPTPASATATAAPTITTTTTTTTHGSNYSHHVSAGNNQQQQQQQQPFTFSLKMWSGECHLLAAASLAERSIWLEAISGCTNGCLLDDEASTDSASSTDSSPTSNLSARSCDIGLSAVRYRAILSQQQQQQQQNDQIAIDKLAMSLRSAIKRREQELRLDLTNIKSTINNNNSNNSEILKHNKQASSQQQQQQHQLLLLQLKSATMKSTNESPHSTSQSRDGILKKTNSDGKLAPEKQAKRDADDDDENDDDDDDDENDNEEEEEDDEVDDGEIERDDVQENEADESETELGDEPDKSANQAFKRRLMCGQQVNSTPKTHSEPKLIGRRATGGDSSTDDEGDSKQHQPPEQCKKQRKRVTFDLSQSTQRLLTSSSGSGSGSDSDTSSQSYGDSSESTLSSVEPEPGPELELELGPDPKQQQLLELEPAPIGVVHHEGLLAERADGASSPDTCAAGGAACHMMDEVSDDRQVAAAPSVGPTCSAVEALVDTSTAVSPVSSEPPNGDDDKDQQEDAESPNKRCLREQAARIEELELKYERAQTGVGLLEMRLSNSCASYAQLELTCARLQGELTKRDELNRSEANRLQARIEELQHKLASSELELAEARAQFLELEQAQQQQQQQQPKPQQRPSAVATPVDAIPASGLSKPPLLSSCSSLSASPSPSPPPVADSGSPKAAAGWLRQIGRQQQQQQQQHHHQKPLFLMHHVRHALVANQQTIGLKLLSQSRQIQRKLNELELKVDKINQRPARSALQLDGKLLAS